MDGDHWHVHVSLPCTIEDVFANAEMLQCDLRQLVKRSVVVKVCHDGVVEVLWRDRLVVRCMHRDAFGLGLVSHTFLVGFVKDQAAALWAQGVEPLDLHIRKLVLPLTDSGTNWGRDDVTRLVTVNDRIIIIYWIHIPACLLQKHTCLACDRRAQIGVDLGAALHEVLHPLVRALVTAFVDVVRDLLKLNRVFVDMLVVHHFKVLPGVVYSILFGSMTSWLSVEVEVNLTTLPIHPTLIN